MVESNKPSLYYTPEVLQSKVHGLAGSRKIFCVVINETDKDILVRDVYNYHGKMLLLH